MVYIHGGPWGWRTEHDIPKNNTDEQPTKALCHLCDQTTTRIDDRKAKDNWLNKNSQSLAQFPDLSQFLDLNLGFPYLANKNTGWPVFLSDNPLTKREAGSPRVHGND